MGVKSVNETFEFAFVLDENIKLEQTLTLKITVLHQYRRSKKISFIVREDIIKIKPGDKEDSIQSEAKVLKKEIEEKLKKKIDESTYEDYESIAKKLEKLEVV